MFMAAARCHAVAGFVFGGKEVQLFGDRTGAHIGLKKLARVADLKTGLFHRLAADAGFGVVSVQLACAGFYHQAIGIAVHKGGKAKLPRQHHRVAAGVEQQQHRAIAPVIGFATLALPAAVIAQVVKRGFLQHIPAVG